MGKTKTILLQVLIGLIPVTYYLFVWNNLPETVPTHFNAKFEADDFGSKSEMLYIILFIFALSIGVTLLLNNLNKVDPKRRYSGRSSLLIKISWTLTIFFSIMSGFMVYTAINYIPGNPNEISPKYVFALLGLLFVALGNLINNVKPNYFVGIRTPWTLNDEENWRLTHHMGSKLWFFGGLLMILLILLLPGQYATLIAAITIIPLVMIPVIYSFYIFKQKKKGITNRN